MISKRLERKLRIYGNILSSNHSVTSTEEDDMSLPLSRSSASAGHDDATMARESFENESDGEGGNSSSSMSSATSGARKKPSKFILATYRMLQEPKNHPAICFSADGRFIEVKNIKLLKTSVLSNYFNHSNVASFTRQLNNYGFETQLSRTGVHQTFSHPQFMRGREDLLSKVLRRLTGGVGGSKEDAQSLLRQSRRREEDLAVRLQQTEEAKAKVEYQNSLLLEELTKLRALLSNRDNMMRQSQDARNMQQQMGHVSLPSGAPPPPPPPHVGSKRLDASHMYSGNHPTTTPAYPHPMPAPAFQYGGSPSTSSPKRIRSDLRVQTNFGTPQQQHHHLALPTLPAPLNSDNRLGSALSLFGNISPLASTSSLNGVEGLSSWFDDDPQ